MGVLNITNDSFSDGGNYLDSEKAYEQAMHLINEGADLIDIGGESSKPGALEVPINVELERVVPVIKKIRAVSDICISIDTYKPEIMHAAVEAGANIINDVFALQKEGSLEMAAHLAMPICLMHMQGKPQTMQKNPSYSAGIIPEIMKFFSERIKRCVAIGIRKDRLILDPGFGFGKKVADNMLLLKDIVSFKQFNLPLLLGVSRKSTIGVLLNKDVNERLIGSVALAVYAALQGVAILRVHDVDETKQALHLINMIFSDT